MHRLLRITVSLIAFLPIAVVAQDQNPAVDPEEPPLLQISGVVTFFEPEWRLLLVQNGKQATKVGLPESAELPDQLAAGDLVEVEGRRFENPKTREFSADRVTRTGTGKLPDAVPVNSRETISTQNENRIVEAEGVVFRAETDTRYRYLQIATDHTPLDLSVGIEETTPAPPDLLGQTVRFRGVLILPVDDGDAVKVLLPDSQLQIETAGDADDEVPVTFQTIDVAIPGRRDETARASIVGQAVTGSHSPEVIVQDASGSIRVESSQLPEIQVGDIVVAKGSIKNGGKRLPVLSGDVVRVGPGQPLVAERVATDKVVKRPYQYLKTTGTLAGFLIREDQRIPILQDKDTAFKVSGSDKLLARFDQLPGGTQLNMTGVCRPRKGKNFQFEFLASDINVLYFPVDYRAESSDNPAGSQAASVSRPAATAPVRATGGLPSLSDLGPDFLLIIAGAALLLMLGLLVAFLILLRRTQERRKFYATIHEQLNEVSHVSRLNTLAEART